VQQGIIEKGGGFGEKQERTQEKKADRVDPDATSREKTFDGILEVMLSYRSHIRETTLLLKKTISLQKN